MRSLAAFLLALTALLLTPTAASGSPSFTGHGQLRALHNTGDHEDLGCLTSEGKWTVEEPLCGVFAADRIDDYQFRLRSIEAGECGVDVATFKCGGGVKAAGFGTWGTPGPVPGYDVLRYSQYGVLATNAPDSPPAPGEEPLAIHFYSGSEKGKWIWLGWKALSDVEAADDAGEN
ncbi:hypothetical protein L209DRAFT_752412 [Thermothelomyces heterothallicus CBS 203.75]